MKNSCVFNELKTSLGFPGCLFFTSLKLFFPLPRIKFLRGKLDPSIPFFSFRNCAALRENKKYTESLHPYSQIHQKFIKAFQHKLLQSISSRLSTLGVLIVASETFFNR